MQLPKLLFTSICALAVSVYSSELPPAANNSTSASRSTDQKTTNAANPVSAPVKVTEITSGTAFTIEWLPTAGSIVTLVLRKGADKSLDVLEVIADSLPNSGAFIWVPSTQLAAGSDYAIEITSTDPPTSNYSAQFKIISNGPGIRGKPIEPSTTRSLSMPSYTSVPKYTGTEAAPPTITGSTSDGTSSESQPPTGAASVGSSGLGKCVFAIVAVCVVMIVL